MRALLSTHAGPPEDLELAELPQPVPGPGEVLVQVRAAGVNFPDSLIIEDKYQVRPERPFAPGCELAGVVHSLGDGVAGIEVGDRVLGSVPFGAFAEFVTLSATRAVALPDSMPFDEAGAFILTYGTSYYALADRAKIQPGETLLVLGAAGGVGIAAVEIGKALGARVVAAVSSDEKAAFALSCGADAAVVYPAGPLTKEQSRAVAEQFKAATGGADVVYDAVGGTYCEPALRALNWNGRYLVVGFPAGIPSPPLNLVLLKGSSIVGVAWGASIDREPEVYATDVRELMKLYEAGSVRPRVSRRYPLAEGGSAIRALMDRSVSGKLVVVVE